jgi:predicted phage baseplate assembly protein
MLNDCGCCEGLSVETPVAVYNRPGLSAIAYRVGTYAEFRESLLARLSISRHLALRQLTTRASDDFTIALLDAWAVVSDVLTFYQERVANESYLGTATEQLSIVELARLIGYELRPGVAAAGYLAFTLEEAPGAAGQPLAAGAPRSQVDLPPLALAPGIKVQSIPGPEEKPQTFETVEAIEARAEWNAIRPRMSQPQSNAANHGLIVVKGLANDLKPGDVLLFKPQDTVKKVAKIKLDEANKTTWVYFDPQAQVPPPAFMPATVFIADGEPADFPTGTALDATVVRALIGQTWSEEDLSALMQTQGWPATAVRESFAAELAAQAPAEGLVFVFRKRAAVFGYNAQKLAVADDQGNPLDPALWREPTWTPTPGDVFLDSAYEQIAPQGYVAIKSSSSANPIVFTVNNVEVRPVTNYGISAKSTVLTLSATTAWWDGGAYMAPIRSVVVYAQSEPLTLAETALEAPVEGTTVVLSRLYSGLKTGQPVILSGERIDLPGTAASELRVLKEVWVHRGYTAVVFDKALAYRYVAATVAINANVALATHGETVRETMGSGDAGQAFQKFMLKQPPLTFVSAATETGTLSTLEVRVNDLLWHEVPSLYGRGPEERIYITRQDDAGRTAVIFGDGRTGARLPSGQENVRATYRKGIGAGGVLKPHQLSQLLSRPLGLKSATNPLGTSGAEDAERLADARRNATLTIFTLGRIVSLRDYEDFARSFAGIAKSLATWSWTGEKRSIAVTVAGVNGTTVDGTLKDNLYKAIEAAGIPEVLFSLYSFEPVFFRLKARIVVRPDYIDALVLAAVEQKLRTHFSFAQRGFGQSVSRSEVIAVMQGVDGVLAVDLDELYRSDLEMASHQTSFRFAPDEETQAGLLRFQVDKRLFDVVPSFTPRPGSTKPLPAQLLLLDSRPVELEVMA